MSKVKKIQMIWLTFISCLMLCVCSPRAEETNENTIDVLIIYSSGSPFDTITDIDEDKVDAVTTPTPAHMNCERISKELFEQLHADSINVVLKKALDIEDRQEILNARVVVIGSPAYFWNVSWQIKKLIDEKFAELYILRSQKKRYMNFAVFTMAEIKSSADQAMQKLVQAIKDCKGEVGPKQIFLAKYSLKKVKKQVKQFADEIIEYLKTK